MKKISLILAALPLCLTAAAWADARVNVHFAGSDAVQQLDKINNVAELATAPALNGRGWWQGALIADSTSSAVARQHYQTVMASLRALAADSSGEDAAAINSLIQQLSTLKVAGRLPVNLDADWVRLRPEANRTLLGEYDLWLPTKPHQVLLFGLMQQPGRVAWQAGQDVRDYLQGHERLAGGERSVVTVIAPNGDTQSVPIAYWNHRHVEVMPGSIIWRGFSSWALPGAYDDLNQQIVNLLSQRIPD